MADGTPLRRALMWAGIRLSEEEIKRLYALREFRRLYRLERRLYQQDKWGRVAPTEIERLRKRIERQIF